LSDDSAHEPRSERAAAPKRCCVWAGEDPLYVRHHDVEWGVPVHDGRALWEHLVLDGFQPGLSWRTVLLKRDHFRLAFAGFEPEQVARFDAKDVDRLMGDSGIIRSQVKISSAISNARAFLTLRENGHEFSEWIWSFVGGAPIENAWANHEQVPTETPLAVEISKALKTNGFKFVGSTIVYAWMQAVGLVNDHLTSYFRYHEVQRLASRPHRHGGALAGTMPP
jgi:DNA-3-methyladenine glycosylase I